MVKFRLIYESNNQEKTKIKNYEGFLSEIKIDNFKRTFLGNESLPYKYKKLAIFNMAKEANINLDITKDKLDGIFDNLFKIH